MPLPVSRTPRTGYRIGFALVLALVLVVVVSTPVAIVSLVEQAGLSGTQRSYSISMPDVAAGPTYTRLHISVIALNEVAQKVTLDLSGYHFCTGDCSRLERLTFFALGTNGEASFSVPPSASIDLPASSEEVSKTITLPMRGNIFMYPFDRYRLVLGVTAALINADGSQSYLPSSEAESAVFLRLQEDVPRLSMSVPVQLEPQQLRPQNAQFDYLYANSVTFSRPDYLKILVVLVIALITAAAAFAVLMRPFDQVIINAGALVLGVWGVRTLLLGGFPPDVTLVDTALGLDVFFLLGAITVRALLLLHGKSDLHLRPRSKVAPAAEAAAACSEDSTNRA